LFAYCTIGTVLKGQCHEMVVEVRPWSGRLGLKVRDSLFPFKNRPFQSYGPQSSASIDVKSGLSDPAEFAKVRRPI
jgi:hypothetical protein